jgi:hypothetical protein
MPTTADKLKLCSGCRDDFYNDKNPLGVKRCWSFRSARVVRRWTIGWWTSPLSPRAYQEVKTLDCHHEPGQMAFQKDLNPHAVNPVYLKAKP